MRKCTASCCCMRWVSQESSEAFAMQEMIFEKFSWRFVKLPPSQQHFYQKVRKCNFRQEMEKILCRDCYILENLNFQSILLALPVLLHILSVRLLLFNTVLCARRVTLHCTPEGKEKKKKKKSCKCIIIHEHFFILIIYVLLYTVYVRIFNFYFLFYILKLILTRSGRVWFLDWL